MYFRTLLPLQLATLVCLATCTSISARRSSSSTVYGDLSSRSSSSNTTSSHLEVRDSGIYIFCNCNDHLNPADTNNVVDKITSGPQDISAGARSANWQQSGNVVGFYCNFANGGSILNAEYRIAVQQQITSVCGQWIAGTVFFTDSNSAIGYMDAPFTQDRCQETTLVAVHPELKVLHLDGNNDLPRIC
jgi:hypothetical protein